MSVVQANCKAIPLADRSVNLVVTSPPYWSHRDYMGESDQIGLEPQAALYLENLWDVAEEIDRVLTAYGSAWFNIGDRMSGSGGYNNAGVDKRKRGPGSYIKTGQEDIPDQSRMMLPERFAYGCIIRFGWLLRAPVIWHKNKIPENAKDRVEVKHEALFHFAKQSPCYADYEFIRKFDSVWDIATQKSPEFDGIKHDATFPLALPARIIRGWCPPGGVVLDVFGGSGTTATAARALGRTGISLDLSRAYCRLAQWRTEQTTEHAKVRDSVHAEASLF